MLTKKDYFKIRADLMREELGHIVAIEKKYTKFLTQVILDAASDIYRDFCQVTELFPFWVNYPPEQRGRKPRGASIPWGDMGEKSIGQSLVRAISLRDASVTYPGLPLGGDVRFATNEALVHFDMKLTGQTDNYNEIVASPHQISGDGAIWKKGIVNPAIDGVANAGIHLPPDASDRLRFHHTTYMTGKLRAVRWNDLLGGAMELTSRAISIIGITCQPLHSFCYFAKTARTRRISSGARAHFLLQKFSDTLRNRGLPGALNLFLHIRSIEAKAVAERDRVCALFQPDAHP